MMEVCQAYMDSQSNWKRRYAELERREHEAEQTGNWARMEIIGEELVQMEKNSSFQRCFICDKTDCPAHFNGFAS